ncbi:MAG: choice-of-anchor F family protein [Sulfurovum sp.]|uniref:choice-of-anchor F family protein n=1 Tax=Sulfurovum sp. TaxID=1969726 RepID=UPI002868365C|nr:choice-of-anchor F family protein [Sulfurovum sp.]MCO4845491.1 choice-of-anchor F family protein [Sulfurovum sp.]
MKKNNKNFLRMSLVTAMLLTSSAYAGKIIGANPTDEVQPLTQFGFYGWYFGDQNIEVDMFKADGTPYVATFDPGDGTYPAMSTGDYFVSSIYNTPAGTLLAAVGGKDYPVGEPAGIKVINGDTLTNNGKPENCIMTTSYLEEAYRDTPNPEPVICSSGFQTHKRFKVKMLSAMVTIPDANGTSVDLKFDLDNDDNSTGIVRYQVFQKINNYTGMRLDGYTLQVLDENGLENPDITLSLGFGENPEESGPDVFDYNTLANFAHGLWGPVDKHFPEPGFFDDTRVYYPVELNDENNTISYAGDLLGGNYQQLFGNWLTNDWAPTGIFWDDDMDPSTDNELVAYWGDPLNTGTVGWHKGNEEGWAEPTITELLAWEASPWYAMGPIEDVLNLGLNYIVNIGENAKIGNTFTIRITPHTDSNITAPSHVGTTPIVIIPTDVGVVAISPAPTFSPGEELTLGVADTDLNTDEATEQNLTIVVMNNTGDEENVLLTETEANSSIFTGTLPTDSINVAGINDGTMTAVDGTIVTAYYTDESDNNATRTAFTTASTSTTPPADDDNPSSGGGGGCTYNENSKSYDMIFLLLAGLGLLYPFRRRFIK